MISSTSVAVREFQTYSQDFTHNKTPIVICNLSRCYMLIIRNKNAIGATDKVCQKGYYAGAETAIDAINKKMSDLESLLNKSRIAVSRDFGTEFSKLGASQQKLILEKLLVVPNQKATCIEVSIKK